MKIVIYIILILTSLSTSSQNNLLNQLNEEMSEPSTEYQPAFKAMKISNVQSTKIASKNDLYMYVSHRFGTVKDGISTFYGLDKANTKIELVYGIIPRMQIGLSRESLRQTYAGSIKVLVKKQDKNFPMNIALYSTVNLNSEINKDLYPLMKFYDRLSYASQLLFSKRINSLFSIQFNSSFIRQNLVLESFQDHNQLAFGTGGRVKINNRLSLNMDYMYNLNRNMNSRYNNPLSIGIDIETGGHVFQLLFSNAQSTNEPGFISNAEGNWLKGDVFFGFNIVRVF